MRWLKHMTNAQDDERIAAFLVDAGLEGYGFYWVLLETIGRPMDSSEKCELTYPLTQWARALKCHHNKVTKYLIKLYLHGLIIVNDWPDLTRELPGYYPGPTPALLDGYLQVTLPNKGGVTLKYDPGSVRVKVPKLLKYRDEYSKKSGQKPEKVRRKDTDTDPEIDPTTTTAHEGLSSESSPSAARIIRSLEEYAFILAGPQVHEILDELDDPPPLLRDSPERWCDWIVLAIKEAADRGVRTAAYLIAIIHRCREDQKPPGSRPPQKGGNRRGADTKPSSLGSSPGKPDGESLTERLRRRDQAVSGLQPDDPGGAPILREGLDVAP